LLELNLVRYSRHDERLGLIPIVDGVVHTEVLGGEDTLEFQTSIEPEKGDRIVWLDPEDGIFREHIVTRTEATWGEPTRVYAENSMTELLADFIDDRQLIEKSLSETLAATLETSRWEVGDIRIEDTVKSIYLYRTNVLAALRRIETLWECEIAPSLRTDGDRITHREIDVFERIGSWRVMRFTYGNNLISCKRTVLDDEVFTALYGYGAGLPIFDEEGNPTGGYTRRLTFGEINGGVNWLGDEEAREEWGIWNADHTEKMHRFGHVIFGEIDEPHLLMGATRRALKELKGPRVAYEIDAADLPDFPGAGLGDDVRVVDCITHANEQFTARCIRRVRTFRETVERHLTLGTLERTSWMQTTDLAGRMGTVEDTAAGAEGTVASYENLEDKKF